MMGDRLSNIQSWWRALLAGFMVAMPIFSAAADQTVVDTKSGPVQGSAERGFLSFKGIPYAAPPVGALRWRAPQPVTSWQVVRSAEAAGHVCMQPVQPARAADFADQSEDCLYLNVSRPIGSAKNLPVLFWIPGGGLVSGSGTEAIYDGKPLVEYQVILVTINYRLGRFGFLAHPGLTKANADGGRLFNYGLMDQIAALRWVHDNIAAFGGDPAKVTIFGESAGGASVDALMISPEVKGLFSAAISESGYGRGNYQRISAPTKDGQPPAEQSGFDLAAALGMPNASIDQLRTVTAAAIVAVSKYDQLLFAVDGVTIPGDLWAEFQAGHEAPVPFILGSNSFEFGARPDMDDRLAKLVPRDKWPALTAIYGDDSTRQNYMGSDLTFTSQARALALRHAVNGFPTYVYRFSVPPLDHSRPGTAHAGEMPYVFGNLTGNHLAPKLTDVDDLRLSNEAMGFWTNMAKIGDPNGKGLPEWPRYQATTVLNFGRDGTHAMIDPLAGRLDALDLAAN